MSHPLELPPAGVHHGPDELLDRFLSYVSVAGLDLYPAQEEAILAVFAGQNVILNTPTGSGKSLVATAMHFKSVAMGRRSVYTCPIKALVNEKFLALCRDFGPDQVGMMTGDATVNRRAPILCCTAEILANMACAEGEKADVHDVIQDEFHYYADRDRGVSWQIPLLALPQARFLLMSATMGNLALFAERLTALNKAPTAIVQTSDRPVPLEFSYAETPLTQTIEDLAAANKAPIYVVHFTQREAAENAQSFTSLNLCSREDREQISRALDEFRFSSPYGQEMKRILRQGIGLHHAGLLPKYRVLVEKLAQQGLLKLICGTDTLGVGVNVPIRTVLLTQLSKYDGEKTRILSVRDFQQISGRAGRKGFDDQGWVVAQAPAHVIENRILEEKAANNPGKRRKMVKRTPPKGFITWDANTYRRLMESQPEALSSSFEITHGILLQVLSRPGDGGGAMRQLIRDSHEPPAARQRHVRRAWQLFRSLLERGIVEILPREPGQAKSRLRVNVDLQQDFSLHQTLSLYLIDTLPLLDPETPDYALDVLTLVESIVENPEVILRRQLARAKTDKMAELKAEGMEYERRIAELDKVEYPKPHRDFIYDTFNAFAAKHPWVGETNIQPKSIAREMFERWMSFGDYVRDYDLQRSEGILLRHLSGVYKTLAQTVPDTAKTEAVLEMETYLAQMILGIDSSLLEEWERMRDPAYRPPEEKAVEADAERPLFAGPRDITSDRRQFTALVRNAIFNRVRSTATGAWEEILLDLLSPNDVDGEPWTPDRLAQLFEPYFAEHERIRLDPEARNAKNTYIREEPDRWLVQQVLVDTQDLNDWSLLFAVDLTETRARGEISLQLLAAGPVEETMT
ncbi:MAG: DUF3516 domain-containing protein [Opitutales bacterium]